MSAFWVSLHTKPHLINCHSQSLVKTDLRLQVVPNVLRLRDEDVSVNVHLLNAMLPNGPYTHMTGWHREGRQKVKSSVQFTVGVLSDLQAKEKGWRSYM